MMPECDKNSSGLLEGLDPNFARLVQKRSEEKEVSLEVALREILMEVEAQDQRAAASFMESRPTSDGLDLD